MTTARDRLAAALRAAGKAWVDDEDDRIPFYEALASALLALPGIAIVAIPAQMHDRSNVAESINDRPMWEIGGAWTSLTDNAGEIEFEADSQNAYGCLSNPAAARDLAAALLAAAAEVER